MPDEIFHLEIFSGDNISDENFHAESFSGDNISDENFSVENISAEDEASAEENGCCCCSNKKKHRQPEEQQLLLNRLRRIEGQVRGVQNMLSEDAYCTDILTQISAIQSALNSFSRELLERHIRTCVVDDIRQGDDEVVTDLVRTIQKLMK